MLIKIGIGIWLRKIHGFPSINLWIVEIKSERSVDWIRKIGEGRC